jgi:hypothetical protein
MVLRNHNVYGFGSALWSGSSGRRLPAARNDAWGATKRPKWTAGKRACSSRSHHGRGGLGIIPKAPLVDCWGIERSRYCGAHIEIL